MSKILSKIIHVVSVSQIGSGDELGVVENELIGHRLNKLIDFTQNPEKYQSESEDFYALVELHLDDLIRLERGETKVVRINRDNENDIGIAYIDY